jgi:hypothetical protein
MLAGMLKLKQKDGPHPRLPVLACVEDADRGIVVVAGVAAVASPSPGEGIKLKLNVNCAPLPALKERFADRSPFPDFASISYRNQNTTCSTGSMKGLE